MPSVACRLTLVVLLVAAAVIDARSRRLPNALALALAACGASCAVAAGGAASLARHALAGLAVCGLLLAFELAWRALRGERGQGMGDIKALLALMLADPLRAVASYAAAMLALAGFGLLARRRSLPLIPFLAACFVLAALI